MTASRLGFAAHSRKRFLLREPNEYERIVVVSIKNCNRAIALERCDSHVFMQTIVLAFDGKFLGAACDLR